MDIPIAIPPPTIVSARTAMPARAALRLRGLIADGLSSITETLVRTVNEEAPREYRTPSPRSCRIARCCPVAV